MKFISPKTMKVYDLKVCVSVQVPDEIKKELADEQGRFTLQIAETKTLEVVASDQPWGDEDISGVWECEAEPAGFYHD